MYFFKRLQKKLTIKYHRRKLGEVQGSRLHIILEEMYRFVSFPCAKFR